MKLLVITQKMDKDDPVLGFFHNWVYHLSLECDQVSVICLQKGRVDLAEKVSVYSLGKENRQSRLVYVYLFFKHLFVLRKEYDAVFVHMNQEYILLAGWYWKMLGRPVYMWRNHHAGNILTDMAASFCRKIFCTSKFSYTAKFRKTVLMPVGIDLDIFKPSQEQEYKPHSLLFLGRVSPVKKIHILTEAVALLKGDESDFCLDIYGDALPVDQTYLDQTKKDAVDRLGSKVKFYTGIPNYQTPSVYRQHLIFVNLSSSGMYDKTIFEAMACGCLVLACNRNLQGKIDPLFIFREDDPVDLAKKIVTIFSWSEKVRERKKAEMISLVHREHSLQSLRKKIISEIQN